MDYQSNTKYVVDENDIFQFMQCFCRYLLTFAERHDGYHPDVDHRDRWMCKYMKKKFKKLEVK